MNKTLQTVLFSTTLWFAMKPFPKAANEFQEHFAQTAVKWNEQLAKDILPYWLNTTRDSRHGGYVLSDSLDGSGQAVEKQIVSQARLVWGFSLAHRRGYGDAGHDYLSAARHGYEFLQKHFLDKENGGYFWSTELNGELKNDMKVVYGQAFVIYAYVELYRAGSDHSVLEQAMLLYRKLMEKAHDQTKGGWYEHFTSDWIPLLDPEDPVIVERAGHKSANTHLHLMEALTELFMESKNSDVGKSLAESLKINKLYFYPFDPGQSAFHRRPDWSFVTDPQSAGLSYGHNVEFAWLMLRAEKALNIAPSRSHFRAHLDHALKYGYDWENGGLYDRGFDNKPAVGKTKIWWVQSEMLAALTDAMTEEKGERDPMALKQLLDFIQRHMADPKDGVWIAECEENGLPKNKSKAHNWKANYHDVRAILKFIETFSGKTAD